MLLFVYTFIYIGVKMEEQRLLIKYKQYKDYMNSIKYRFIPYVLWFFKNNNNLSIKVYKFCARWYLLIQN